MFGAGTSNVFDGAQELGGGLKLKGVTVPHVDIGYLSEVEALQYLTVGERYKYPRLPIWVLGSQTHYTVLFSGDAKVAKIGNSHERKCRRAFNKHCLDVEAGMCDIAQLDAILDELRVDNREDVKENIKRKLLGSDIFVWSELWEQLEIFSQLVVERFDLFLYDGQDPPGPNLQK